MIRRLSNDAGLALVMLTAMGCATHQPMPIVPAAVLEGLNAVKWPGEAKAGGEAVERGIRPRELAAVAVSKNPELAAARAEVGIRQALLVEAGLLPDPQVGWDAMNVVASDITDGASTSNDVIAGIGLTFPLPRPGEIGARVDAAAWRLEEARRRIATAEWSLTRRTHVAYEELRAANLLQAQTTALVTLAQSTYDYFKRALDASAATAIQANLALSDLQALQLDAIRIATRVEQARLALNALVGLPPDTLLDIRGEPDPAANDALESSASELTSHALQTRPDLSMLLARYEAAENEIRVAISKQFPRFAIGTALSMSIPIFTHFARPAIRTAIAKREQVARSYQAAVHAARQEIAASRSLWLLSQQEVAFISEQLLPTAEANLELSKEALQAGEATLLETLALQRALVRTRTRHTEARAERSKRAWTLLAASGWLLAPPPPAIPDTTQERGSK